MTASIEEDPQDFEEPIITNLRVGDDYPFNRVYELDDPSYVVKSATLVAKESTSIADEQSPIYLVIDSVQDQPAGFISENGSTTGGKISLHFSIRSILTSNLDATKIYLYGVKLLFADGLVFTVESGKIKPRPKLVTSL